MFRGDYDNTTTNTRRYEQRDYRGGSQNNRDYDNRDYGDNRGGWFENMKENVRDWWRGDDYDNRGSDYNRGDYNRGSYQDRDYDRSGYNRTGNYNTDSSRFNVTGRRVADYDDNYRNTTGYGVQYGGGSSGGYGSGSRDYDRSYGQQRGGGSYGSYNTSGRDYDRSYGGGYSGGYGGYGGGSSSNYNRDYDRSYGTSSSHNRGGQLATYRGTGGGSDYDRLYGNRDVTRRYNDSDGGMLSNLFGGALSFLHDRSETTPTIVEEGGQRMMQWQFDVQGFNLDDITISDAGSNKIEITGKHEDTGAHHRHARHFTRIITLPQNTTTKDVKSRIGGSGLLTVSVPFTGKSLNDYNSRELAVGTSGTSRTTGSSSYGTGSTTTGTTTGTTGTTTTTSASRQHTSTSNA